MGALFVYVLKVSFCLTLFYLFYKLLLSKETFYRFNRVALLCLFALSLLIPFFEVSLNKLSQLHYTLVELEQLINPQTIVSGSISPPLVSANWINAILLIYMLGVILFFIRSVYSFLRIYFLVHRYKFEKYNGVRIITHNLDLAPFSWMNFIVVSEADLVESRNEILVHELSHIKHYHSIDLLLTELCAIIQWFNPAVWLMKKELQTIHEYEADNSVINSGIDAKKYQLLLIKKAVGTLRFTSMTNSFNHSKLKKRITMMLKEKSNPWAMAKYLYALPLIMLSITLFARPEISATFDEISNAKVSEISSISGDTITDLSVEDFVATYCAISSDTAVTAPKNQKDEVVVIRIDEKKNASTKVKSKDNPEEVIFITSVKDKSEGEVEEVVTTRFDEKKNVSAKVKSKDKPEEVIFITSVKDKSEGEVEEVVTTRFDEKKNVSAKVKSKNKSEEVIFMTLIKDKPEGKVEEVVAIRIDEKGKSSQPVKQKSE